MFERFRKPKAQEPVKYEPSGFFSTDDSLPITKSDRIKRLNRALQVSFQKTALDFKPVNASGELIAMDSADNCGVASAKNYSGVYGSIPEAQFAWYAGQGFIGYQTAAILAQNWLIEKCCEMPAKDAARHGYEITVNDGTDLDPEVLDYIRKQDKAFGVKQQCVEMVSMGRVFGIRVCMFIVDSPDKDYYVKPFNPDGVRAGSYRGMTQIDPYWITPELDADAAANPASMHFYEPTWWRVNGNRIHRSHLVIFRNGQIADILKPSYLYGGIPVPQRIMERIYAAERTANEAPMLAMTKRLTTLNVDVTQALANMEQFQEKMGLWTQLMNNFGVKIIGGDEKIEQFDTSLADLDAVIMTQYQIVAAAAGVPATKLLGTTPKGFNSTGEYEESSYHEELETIQEHDLSPLVDRHHLLLIRSHVAPKFGMKPFDTEVNWKPVDSPTAAELAEINSKNADTDSKLVAAGAIDGFDVRERLINNPDSGYNGIAPIVEGGPGDREAELEAKEAAQENQNDPAANEA